MSLKKTVKPKKLTPAQKLDIFVHENNFRLIISPNFSLGEDGSIRLRPILKVEEKPQPKVELKIKPKQ